MALFFNRGSLFWCSVYRYRTLVSFAFVWVSVPFPSAFFFLWNVLVLFVHFCVYDPFMSRADWTLVQLRGRQYVGNVEHRQPLVVYSTKTLGPSLGCSVACRVCSRGPVYQAQ